MKNEHIKVFHGQLNINDELHHMKRKFFVLSLRKRPQMIQKAESRRQPKDDRSEYYGAIQMRKHRSTLIYTSTYFQKDEKNIFLFLKCVRS